MVYSRTIKTIKDGGHPTLTHTHEKTRVTYNSTIEGAFLMACGSTYISADYLQH